jgi:hypothetical protein
MEEHRIACAACGHLFTLAEGRQAGSDRVACPTCGEEVREFPASAHQVVEATATAEATVTRAGEEDDVPDP